VDAVAASTGEIVVSIVVATILGVAWLVTMFVIGFDSLPVGGKVLWWVLVTLLAPIAIPVYFVLRHRRSTAAA
jgi:hypothetical protein